MSAYTFSSREGLLSSHGSLFFFFYLLYLEKRFQIFDLKDRSYMHHILPVFEVI